MIINHNIAALNTLNHLNAANNAQSKAMQKLSSGLRINSAADDAAGLAISEKMRGQIRGLDQATRNAQDGTSMIQTAEGALNETQDILQRMRELAVQASNDTNTADDRNEIQKEISQLNSEIDRISGTTEFNTKKLLDGSMAGSATSSDVSKVAVDSSSGLKVGTYTVTVSTAATKATLTGSTTYASDDAVATAFNAEKDITINGVQIDTTGVNTGQKLADAINAKSEQTGFTASFTAGQGVKFTANEFGSGKNLTIGGADSGLLNTTATLTQGKDAVATITDSAGTSQSVTGTGQKLIYGTAEFTAKTSTNGDSVTITVDPSVSFQIGANKDQTMKIDINQMDTTTLGNSTDKIKDVNVLTTEGAEKAIKTLDDAIKQVSSERSKLGAYENRLDHTVNNLTTSSENLTSAESRIRDVDYALAA
ncbi:flagellin [Heyndrickxia coagulans]|uniref:flagellin N-terminal helical domain-containing protein n=2 Tax=Bacillota TaxID=1239 RepID=UPI000628919A|nr:flagellin [Heyndrickxia coagulans]